MLVSGRNICNMVTGGITTFKKIGKDSFDILYVDGRKNIYSSVDMGAKVQG